MSCSKLASSFDDPSHDRSSISSSVFTDDSSGSAINDEGLFSRKVFVGGLPFNVTENDLRNTFGRFGVLHVDWPRCQDLLKGHVDNRERQPNGYVFLIFHSEEAVDKLVNHCFINNGRYFLEMTTRTSTKSVQVRPWRKSDSFYIIGDLNDPISKINPHHSVFIGGVPRPTRAVDLVNVLEEAYGKVLYASIDMDPELHYPKGAARIVFERFVDFKAAMKGRHIMINHCGIKKRVDIKPYIIDEQCCDACVGTNCDNRSASYFCAFCLMYLCERCWDIIHPLEISATKNPHLPYIRCGDATKQLTYIPHHIHRFSNISDAVYPPLAPMYYNKMVYPSGIGNPCRIQG
ncbi:hypothetical protein FO519_000015 [Halicephalobus sp. NKZ332]|nr:hypothetical protein FO519_000015 [Halicephalobus sp. NKZ332]